MISKFPSLHAYCVTTRMLAKMVSASTSIFFIKYFIIMVMRRIGIVLRRTCFDEAIISLAAQAVKEAVHSERTECRRETSDRHG